MFYCPKVENDDEYLAKSGEKFQKNIVHSNTVRKRFHTCDYITQVTASFPHLRNKKKFIIPHQFSFQKMFFFSSIYVSM